MSGAHDVLERCGNLAHDALDVIPDLAADPQRFEWLWRDEWSAYEASVRAVAEGWATIEELPEFDLAVVLVEPVTMVRQPLGGRRRCTAPPSTVPRRVSGWRRCEGEGWRCATAMSRGSASPIAAPGAGGSGTPGLRLERSREGGGRWCSTEPVPRRERCIWRGTT